ncbi:MAG: alpha/beta hydrolase [Dehalococcoidales bacterium]|nr:alpha/beta hydrolase [Dehalococcoidales bacterium]
MDNSIFMIHGMWNGGWCWKEFRNFFEGKGYSCFTPTLRFHDVDPKEPPHPELGTTSLLDYAADLENEIRKLDHPPIIIGHSMGGLLAQILGSRGLARALVLLAPAPPRGIIALKPSSFRGVWSCITRRCFWRKPCRQTYNEAVYSTMNLLPAEKQKETYEKMVSESGRAVFEIGLWFLDSNRASEVDASKVTCPALVIGGTQDRLVPTSTVRKIARRYKGLATYHEYADHAHKILTEPGWQDIAEDIAGWLKTALNGEYKENQQ